MDEKVDKDVGVLAKFMEVYCMHKHPDLDKEPWLLPDSHDTSNLSPKPLLCHECSALLDYSAYRRRLCPFVPKPTCKNCKIHCYAPENRAKIREVMRFSGMYMIKKGRVDMIFHYLL